MTPHERDRMNSLCIQVQEEKDYQRFQTLLHELSELVRQKELRFPEHDCANNGQRTRPWKKVSGTAQKIVKDAYKHGPDVVEVDIPEAHDLFREIRIENTFTDRDGHQVSLKLGAHLEVMFEAEARDTIRKSGQHEL
jgi:lipoate-protein ligase A